ncbi:MAG: hypothetical protein COU46_02710 [Candidatus Niyogibacteria bacterium CG10_big_fil_rev_8_21_14_0_10_42_19]|uniref:Uncharacterized protein n=1 Tax=Candidatus Niyogibacteria bacterium CG10_big_fil_rev_8_21_14_0_10_42_19 TaxID=1974725 RepID=A0A2H0TF34_9BACT|nr:MAG: hypothetical protein COU46_02710 [Candidatus Niyogibacteria bacterium CG10_big_fil_rev_8_21_14_0_10_42_19]
MDKLLALTNPLAVDSFPDLVERLARAVTIVAVPAIVLVIIWAGLLFVTASGNETQLKKAKDAFFWGVIGGMVLLGAWGLAIVVSNFGGTL